MSLPQMRLADSSGVRMPNCKALEGLPREQKRVFHPHCLAKLAGTPGTQVLGRNKPLACSMKSKYRCSFSRSSQCKDKFVSNLHCLAMKLTITVKASVADPSVGFVRFC